MIRTALIMGSIAIAAMAAETPLVTHSEFSFIDTKGNTDTSSLAFDVNAKKSWDLHNVRIHADAYQSSDSGTTSKEKWSVELNYDYQYSEHFSFNYLIGYKDDRFSGFDYQFYTGPGIGYKVLNGSEHKLDVQANILYSQDKPEGLPAESYVGGKLGALYQWQILENLKFIQEANYRTSLEDVNQYFLYSKTGIEVKINSIFSMGVGYKIDYANNPPATFEHTDRTFLASLIIDY